MLQVRTTEKALLERSRENLNVMRHALATSKGSHLVPSVLGTFSVALVVAGTFLNACMGSGRLLTYHCEAVQDFVTDLAAEDDAVLLAVASWRTQQAGVPMPWLDKGLAEIQAVLELFQEKQRDAISSHLVCVNKIMEISRMLTDSGTSVVVALWAYITNSFTVAFAQDLVEELTIAIERSPESFRYLIENQTNTEQKVADVTQAIASFKANGQLPAGVTAILPPGHQDQTVVSRIRASLHQHAQEIGHLRSAIEDFDRAMSAMAQTLPSFVRSLLKFVAIWNTESRHLANPD